MMRMFFVCSGFHLVKVKGHQADTKEAPILALAPHSSFFDALPVVYLGGPSIVAKAETGRLPFFGSTSFYPLSTPPSPSPSRTPDNELFSLRA
jgi:lysophosphatidylcholine acyltransferase/lyso-PAF acetyltransferase